MIREHGSLQGMEVAVYGGTSKIARMTIDKALDLGANVSVLVRDAEKARNLEAQGVTIFQGDITNPQAVESVVAGRGIDAALNFAAVFDQSRRSAASEAVNVEGERNVLHASEKHGVKRHIFISTTGVHVGSPYAYGDSKQKAERLVEASDVSEWVILRYANVLGTDDKRDLWNMPHAVLEIAGRKIVSFSKIPFRENTQFSYLSAENASNAAVAALHARANQTITVLDGYTTIESYLHTMARVNGVKRMVSVDGRHVIQGLYVAAALAEMFGKELPVVPAAAEFVYDPPVEKIGTSQQMQDELGLTPVAFEEIYAK